VGIHASQSHKTHDDAPHLYLDSSYIHHPSSQTRPLRYRALCVLANNLAHIFQVSEPRMSSMDRNEVVKDQPKVCFNSETTPQSHDMTNWQFATKPSMPMTPKNAQNGGGGNRNALRVPVMEDGLRGWSYDIFDCFADRRTCMCGLRSSTLSSPAVSQLTGDFRRPVLLLLLLCLFTEQAATGAP
jgi:hypothetical protein